jgi:hypothetical protein
VANETLVENFVNGFAVVHGAHRLAHHTRAVGHGCLVWHDFPEMNRGAERIVATALI